MLDLALQRLQLARGSFEFVAGVPERGGGFLGVAGFQVRRCGHGLEQGGP
ncbi:hypothetical protein ACQPW3_29480 [Actinosynnema sp. CA-248983]